MHNSTPKPSSQGKNIVQNNDKRKKEINEDDKQDN